MRRGLRLHDAPFILKCAFHSVDMHIPVCNAVQCFCRGLIRLPDGTDVALSYRRPVRICFLEEEQGDVGCDGVEPRAGRWIPCNWNGGLPGMASADARGARCHGASSADAVNSARRPLAGDRRSGTASKEHVCDHRVDHPRLRHPRCGDHRCPRPHSAPARGDAKLSRDRTLPVLLRGDGATPASVFLRGRPRRATV